MTGVRTRIAVGIALGSLLVVGGPAAADHSYFASAKATALEATIAGQGLTIGLTDATIQSVDTEDGCAKGIQACSSALGALLGQDPLSTGTAVAEAPGNEGPNDATGFPIPEDFSPLLTGGIGVAQAAATGGANPLATSDAGAFELALTATQTLADNIPVQDVLDQVGDNILDPLADADPTGVVTRVRDTVDMISQNLTETPILTIAGGPSSASSESKDGIVTSKAASFGVNIAIAPTTLNLPTAPDGLVVIEMGAGTATVQSDQFEAEADFDPAIVRLKFLDPGTGEYDVIEVAPGQSQCTPFEGTPLEPLQVCITAGNGSTEVDGAKATAIAEGVAITAFADPLPQVRIATAAAEATVNAAPPLDDPTPPAAPPTAEPPSLPRTGGAAVLPALALLGLGVGATRRFRG